MRHIHVEITHPRQDPHTEPPPAREGDLPPPGGVVSGSGMGSPRTFGEEEIRLQKVYQLSILSQRGGFADPADGQRTLRPGVKRGQEEPSVTHKRPHLTEPGPREGEGEDSDGEVLCGPGQLFSQAGLNVVEHRDNAPLSPHAPNGQTPRTALPARRPALHNHHRPLPDGQAPLSPKYQALADPQAPLSPRYSPLSDPHSPHSPRAQPPVDPHSPLSPKYQPMVDPLSPLSPRYQALADAYPPHSPRYSPLADPHSPVSPRSQPLSDPQTPLSPRAQTPVDPHTPLSPKYQPLLDPHSPLSPRYSPLPDPHSPHSPRSIPLDDIQQSTSSPHPCDPATLPRTETPSEGSTQGFIPGQCGSEEECSNGSLLRLEACMDHGLWQLAGSPPTEPLGPQEAKEWVASLEASPPDRRAASSNSMPSSEKTPSLLQPSGGTPSPCPAKKRLLSSSDTGESCSEDEGPSTSKKSRLALLGPGLGLGACRSTDAKGAPFWNHLLPVTRERPKGTTDGARVGRRLNCGIRLKSRQLRSGRRSEPCRTGRSSWPSASISHSLLGNFEESILKGRFPPSGRIEGFTAEIGASGSYCPQHATLPVQVTYYDISEHSAPSPFLGVIYLDPLGKKGYSVPKAGTIQVTLFNPNKTVVKMFLVTYNFGDMPVNHLTFLRHRIYLVPVEEGEGKGEGPEGMATDRKKILCYLIHLRFQSSKSGKLYLHDDIRLLFSRKSIEVDTGIPYEQKSYTEVPRNPKYSPRV
ncbi:hypothetical protein JZ751_001088 [Albula glossodonta]|uniref:Atos homolog protein B n=1 Tax=Albula glossodonta TaxID=121402 RepID=A0A8T2PSV5_9TELE|nr:hypothetical protein JZ751_001088 [Albula glossodonta]